MDEALRDRLVITMLTNGFTVDEILYAVPRLAELIQGGAEEDRPPATCAELIARGASAPPQ